MCVYVMDSQYAVVFQGLFWDCCTGGGGSVGSDTHCGDEAADWRGALTSTRVDEEEIVSVEEEVEAIITEPLQIILCERSWGH